MRGLPRSIDERGGRECSELGPARSKGIAAPSHCPGGKRAGGTLLVLLDAPMAPVRSRIRWQPEKPSPTPLSIACLGTCPSVSSHRHVVHHYLHTAFRTFSYKARRRCRTS
ncbi:hypothetical protein MRX96_040908 [Rhipicephalus microplus]